MTIVEMTPVHHGQVLERMLDESGKSKEVFAASVGISRNALHHNLKKEQFSIRILRALKNHGVDMRLFGIVSQHPKIVVEDDAKVVGINKMEVERLKEVKELQAKLIAQLEQENKALREEVATLKKQIEA